MLLGLEHFKLRDGTQIIFWEDTWCGNVAFKYLYPNLYAIVRKKKATVSDVFRTTPLNVAFRRSLVGNNLGSVWLWSQVERSRSIPDSRNGAALFCVW